MASASQTYHGSFKVKVTILASEWGSSKEELSTINRELAIQLAKCPEMEITVFLPQCSQKDEKEALKYKVKIVEATSLPGFKHLDWLCFPPEDLQINIVVGHGVKLGKQAQVIKNFKKCKWVQMVHTDPEELLMFKSYFKLNLKSEEKDKTEVELCKLADHVVGIGPKLSEAFRSYLRGYQKDDNILDFTPGVFEEFETVKQVPSERKPRSVLVFGRGDEEDFNLKGFDIAGRAIAALKDTRLVFVGAPKGKHEEIAERLNRCGVPLNRLRVRGVVEDRESLKHLFQEVDLAVLSSRTEGFGMTGLEALSAGLPVVVGHNSGFGEALCSVPFGSSFVVNSEDPADWSAAIQKLWDKDRKIRLDEVKKLRDSYGRKYNWAEQIKELVNKMISLLHDDSLKAVLSSRTEGFGMTGLEALSAGLPVVVSHNSGFGEALCSIPFGSSFVVNSEDPADWTAAIQKLLDKDRKSRLDELKALCDSYGRKYNWAEQIKELVNKMISLLDASSGLGITWRVSQRDLTSWERLGEGGFSRVYKAKLKGNDVAVKVLKNLKETKALLTEGNLLRHLHHDNIVAFRGMNIFQSDIVYEKFTLKAGTPFLVMEYIPKNVYTFVEDHKTPESQGLPTSQLDVRSLRVKLADFGLSRTVERTGNDLSLFCARWTAPEVWEDYLYFYEEPIEENEALEDQPTEDFTDSQDDESFFLRADIFSYGQVVAYTLTGKMPWHGSNSLSVAGIQNNMIQSLDQVEIPEELSGKLRGVIHDCRLEDPEARPTADRLVLDYFSGDMNPYQAEAKSAEFFSCGFLQHTSIFVAESLVDESSEGFFKTGVRPQGFPAQCLLCKVEVGNEEYNAVPKEWAYEQKYQQYYARFRQAAIDMPIEDLPAIALKSLVTSREEEQERQEIQLSFGQTTFCHHRAIREIWRKLEERTKREFVVCKNTVHPVFSTSFGLHVAVLTADNPQKFIFTRISNREGMPTPSKFTCGAVERASVKDYVYKDGQGYVNLIQTAARELKEELHVELKGSDIEALRLTTIYLKFDTHEWGCCGYVDLSDPRVSPERRLTWEQIESRFTSGPKDKFKYANLVAVDFELSEMVEFVRDNYKDFASSAKLVVVKVLQSFFGVAAVERAFRVYIEDRESVSQNADSQI